MSEDTPEGMFNFEPEPEVFDSKRYEATPSLIPTVYGPDLHPTITDISVRIPSQPKPKQPNVGKIMKKFESDSRTYLNVAMRPSCLSSNLAESDATWVAYTR